MLFSGAAAEQVSFSYGGEEILHDAPLMLFDEPTSNLDVLNECVILQSLSERAGEKTVVLVSHRESTMNIADTVFEMSRARQS